MSRKTGGFEDLLVWRRGIGIVKQIYRLTAGFPPDERFGLTSQMRRAAVSVPSNVAEGQARHTTRDFIRFVAAAEGSLAELATQLEIARDLGYCSDADEQPVRQEITEIRRMLNALRRSLQKKTLESQ